MSEKNTEIEQEIKKQVKKQFKEQMLKNNVYNGWLVSNSLVKRSIGVIGHYFLGYLILIPIIMIIVFIFATIWGFTR